MAEWEVLAARRDALRARKNALLTGAFGAVGLATVLLVFALVARWWKTRCAKPRSGTK